MITNRSHNIGVTSGRNTPTKAGSNINRPGNMPDPFGEYAPTKPTTNSELHFSNTLDTLENSTSANNAPFEHKFEYKTFYITRVVEIPSVVLMVVTSLLLLYIIVKHLRQIMKLYLSIIFYSASVLFFVSQFITMQLYNRVRNVKWLFNYNIMMVEYLLKFLVQKYSEAAKIFHNMERSIL